MKITHERIYSESIKQWVLESHIKTRVGVFSECYAFPAWDGFEFLAEKSNISKWHWSIAECSLESKLMRINEDAERDEFVPVMVERDISLGDASGYAEIYYAFGYRIDLSIAQRSIYNQNHPRFGEDSWRCAQAHFLGDDGRIIDSGCSNVVFCGNRPQTGIDVSDSYLIIRAALMLNYKIYREFKLHHS